MKQLGIKVLTFIAVSAMFASFWLVPLAHATTVDPPARPANWWDEMIDALAHGLYELMDTVTDPFGGIPPWQ